VLREAVALQAKHAKDKVHVLCLFVPPDPSQESPEDFIERRPEAAKLAVAFDKGAVLPAFGQLLGEVNIETAVVIDGEGRVAWHGEVFPDLGPALAAVVAGDAAAIEKLVADRYAIKTSAKPHVEALTAAMSGRDWDQVVAEVDSLLALDAQDFADVAYMKYQALVVAGKQPDAAAWGRELVAGPLKDDEGQLNAFAWWIVDPAGGPEDAARDIELALTAAERACELSSQRDAPLLDTLARAHWNLGHRDEAIELQKKAVKLAVGPDMQATVKKALDEYLKAPKH
jgi:tetratricopeptide (TPR) repeat protein